MPSDTSARIVHYGAQVRRYWAEASRPHDFVKIMRVRLSQSKLGAVACRRPITVVVNLRTLGRGIVLRSHTTDISVLEELILGDSYVPAVRHRQGGAATIVDLGANTGLAARWLLAASPSATIVCVEPEPSNVAVLRRNLESHPSSVVYAACVGGYERQVGLQTDHGEFAYRMVDGPVGNGSSVGVVTMDRILQECGIEDIDLLKCDIEGAEQELFASCASWIGKVKLAVVECHGDFDAPALVEVLRDNGAAFDIVHRDLNPAFRCEIVTLRAGR